MRIRPRYRAMTPSAGERKLAGQVHTMADEDNSDDEYSLTDVDYTSLTNLSRSVREQFDDLDGDDIPTSSPTKEELIDAFAQAGVRAVDEEEFVREVDGDDVEVELLESREYDSSGGGSTGPKTVLYCFPRQATTEDDIRTISESLEEEGYEIKPSEGEGDKFMIQRPADHEAAPDSEDADAAESESEDDEEDESEDEEESADEASTEDDEQESEEESDLISYEVARDNLMDKNKDEVYSIAVDEDVDGRSDMSKEELVDAILDNRVGDKVAAPA